MHGPDHDHCDAGHGPPTVCWDALELIIRSDPAFRCLTSVQVEGRLIGHGQLEAAAIELAEQGESIGIVTGFCVIGTDGSVATETVAAETDGPPGALFLAKTLLELGLGVTIISDSLAMPLLEAGCDLWGIDQGTLLEFPFEPGTADDIRRTSNAAQHNESSDAWVNTFLDGPGGRLTHLVSIERCGPSHSLRSIAEQTDDGELLTQFEQHVPNDARDVCHNMRGQSINGHTAKTHRLFEILAERELPIITMAIGDGGNELGMGRYSWDLLRAALTQKMSPAGVPAAEWAGRIPCRISTDLTLVAGVSNWGAYAMAAAVAALRGNRELLGEQRVVEQRELIEVMVRHSGALDGVTGLPTATVDGIELDAYLSVLTDLLALCRGVC